MQKILLILESKKYLDQLRSMTGRNIEYSFLVREYRYNLSKYTINWFDSILSTPFGQSLPISSFVCLKNRIS